LLKEITGQEVPDKSLAPDPEVQILHHIQVNALQRLREAGGALVLDEKSRQTATSEELERAELTEIVHNTVSGIAAFNKRFG
jgi:phosphoenolpyruvate carboxylase